MSLLDWNPPGSVELITRDRYAHAKPMAKSALDQLQPISGQLWCSDCGRTWFHTWRMGDDHTCQCGSHEVFPDDH